MSMSLPLSVPSFALNPMQRLTSSNVQKLDKKLNQIAINMQQQEPSFVMKNNEFPTSGVRKSTLQLKRSLSLDSFLSLASDPATGNEVSELSDQNNAKGNVSHQTNAKGNVSPGEGEKASESAATESPGPGFGELAQMTYGQNNYSSFLAEEYSESENQLESRMEWGMERLEIQSAREKPKMRGLPKVFFINRLSFLT